MRIARSFRFAMLAPGAMGVAACAAILGIDDRGPIGSGDGDAALGDGSLTDSPTGDGGGSTDGDGRSTDGPTADANPQCDPVACSNVGGTCTASNVCKIACTTTTCPNNFTFNCPSENDCLLACPVGGCDKIRCVGGRSCTIDCSASTSCHNGASCQSGRCEILCTGPVDSCGGGGGADPVLCEAGVCLVTCSGPNSCTAGVVASATTYCAISCTGDPSCSEVGAAVTCGTTPDASIFCGPGPKTCEHGKPSCSGAHCSIQCLGPDSCQDGYCCEATNCVVDASQPRPSVCPP